MNDLVYVMYNLNFKSKQIRKIVAIPFDEIESDNEWITEEGDNVVRLSKLKLKMMV